MYFLSEIWFFYKFICVLIYLQGTGDFYAVSSTASRSPLPEGAYLIRYYLIILPAGATGFFRFFSWFSCSLFSLKEVAPKKKDLAKKKERVRGLRTHTAKTF